MAKKLLEVSNVETKTFSYSLDGVSFNFSIRTDVKKELLAAKEILTRAIKDFDEVLTERF